MADAAGMWFGGEGQQKKEGKKKKESKKESNILTCSSRLYAVNQMCVCVCGMESKERKHFKNVKVTATTPLWINLLLSINKVSRLQLKILLSGYVSDVF